MQTVMGERVSKILNFAVTAFILILFSAMLSAAGALSREAFGLPFGAGVLGMAAICFFTVIFGINAIIRINTILTPILIFGGVLFAVYSITAHTVTFVSFTRPLQNFSETWIWAAVVYASYNIITAISMLVAMNPLVETRRTAKYAGLLGGGIIAALGAVFALPLLFNFTLASRFEIPLLALAQTHGTAIEYAFIILLFAAIYTTAAANGYFVVDWAYKRKLIPPVNNRYVYSAVVCVMGALLAHIGFSSLVADVFPLFGYLGLFEIFTIIIFFIVLTRGK
jgi:uncharacterized membrane protein YkvI